jgi:hypothetical protein
MRALIDRREQLRSDRGAIAITVALSLVALLGAAAIAVDLGYVWSQRRNMVTATDAAALAAARDYAFDGVGCPATATDYLDRNHASAQLVDCTADGSSQFGFVTVNALTDVEYFFARVFGHTDGAVESSTSVKWGVPYAVTGLRPFGLCGALPDGETPTGWLAELFDWIADPTSPQVIRIPYGKDDNPEACNGDDDVPGNWGMIDFDGGANSNNDTKDWVEFGYDGLVNAGTIGENCTTEAWACYEGDTGAFSNSLGSELDSLIPDEEFAIPLFDFVEGNGANAQFHLIAFAKVKLVDYKANGSADSRWLEFEFRPGLITGECCVETPSVDTGIRATAICAVDPDDLSQCQP